MKRLIRALAALFLVFAPNAGRALEQVTLVLNWVPGADHAPFFFAMRQGWYAQADIALAIDSVAGSPEAVKRAAAHADTLAVSDFVSYLRVRGDLPETTAIMALQPHSPYAIYYSADTGIRRVQDLAGKRLAAQAQDPMRKLWQPLAQRNGVAAGSVTWVERSNPAKPDALAAAEADAALNPFLHNHLNYAAVLGARMRVLWWHELGFAAYGHVLVASRESIERAPERFRSFVAVTQRAWAHCLADAAPCIDALLAEHPHLDRAREEEVWKLVAQIHRICPDPHRPLGAFDPARVGRTMQDLDLAFGPPASTRNVTDNTFLDQRIPPPQ